jgi:AAA domain
VTRNFQLIPFEQLRPREGPPALIKGLIPAVGLTVVWGPPKSGKSFWTFDAMMHVALGWEYRGRKVIAGPVVYCAMEGAEGYGKRAEAFRQRRLAEHADDVPFFLVDAPIDLVADHNALITAIRGYLEDESPTAVVLDTLNRSLRGSESDDKDMAAYIKAADAIREAFSCAVIIVHHCGVDGTRPRGHTSLMGAADAQLSVKRELGGFFVVRVEWMKDGPEGDTLKCRLEQIEVGRDSDDDPITSCIVEPATEAAGAATVPDDAKPLPKSARVALKALEKAIGDSGQPVAYADGVPAGTIAVTVDQWREQAYRAGISPSGTPRARQQAFQRARDAVVTSGKAIVAGEHAWLALQGEQGGEHANALS